MGLYKTLFLPIAFSWEAEKAHNLTFKALKWVNKIPGVSQLLQSAFVRKSKDGPIQVMGLQFPNRIGLAAGFDKNAALYRELSYLGFGHIEVGTVTPKPQEGNPKPRLFRLKEDLGIINRMGFNNNGLESIIEHLKNRPKNLIIGGNIGKNKTTPNEEAVRDYEICFEGLYPYVDYFVVNVSSPNTPDLRALQDKEPLLKILRSLKKINQQKPKQKPILLKIAPDLNENQLDDIIEMALDGEMDGLISNNTTISREGLKTPKNQIDALGAGGLSGAPLRNRSDEVLAYLGQKLKGKTTLIACGGINSVADAQRKIDLGADLVQIYTGFIYQGPALIRDIGAKLYKKKA